MKNEETAREIAQLLKIAADAICHAADPADQLNQMAKMENGSEINAAENRQMPQLTLEDVRKVAADKARQGFTKEVRSLIQKYGADKLSGMDAAQYEAFLKELEVIGHAG